MSLRILLIITIITLGIFFLFLLAENFTGYSVLDKFTGYSVLDKHTFALDKHTFTKAVCDENNYCEDYVFVCENEKAVSMTPTGAVIQFSEDWKDPRSEEMINRGC